MTRADLEVAQGKLKNAEKTLSYIVNEYPADAEAGLRLAQVLAARGKTADAKRVLAGVIGFAPWHSASRDYLLEIEKKEREARPQELDLKVRVGVAGTLALLALILLVFNIYDSRGQATPGKTVETTCTVPGQETPTPTAEPPDTTSAPTPTVDLAEAAPTATEPPTPVSTSSPLSPTPIPQRFVGAKCTEQIATSVVIKETHAASDGSDDIPTTFLGIMGALFFAALLVFLLPFIKTIAFANAKIELNAPEEPSKQQPGNP